MLTKILPRHTPSYASALSYTLQEKKQVEHTPIPILHNMRGRSQEEWVQEFYQNEACRKHPRKGQVYFYHDIISLSAKEDKGKITNGMLTDLAYKYISLRSRSGMYVGAIHRDKEHIHIHLCISGVEYRTGKALRLSKQELHTLKVKFQEYHTRKYPELTHSTVNHGTGKEYVTNKEYQARHRDARALRKDAIKTIVQECFTKATTQKEFLESLQDNNLHYYERKGVPTGLIYQEMKIRFSRLDVRLDSLRPDRTEERTALAEIQKLRTAHKELSKERNR